jgi:hypothetical protein
VREEEDAKKAGGKDRKRKNYNVSGKA